jgi:hypothetical protein
MARIRFSKLAIVFVILLLTIGIGSRVLFSPSSVNAEGMVKYRVVTTGAANTVYEYEKLLNDMAFQGWEFDHRVASREWAIFKK